jgi:hypothetical protein
VRRGPLAVTLDAARAQRGMATPRQGQARAMARTPPAGVRLDAILTLPAHRLSDKGTPGVRRTAW